MPTPEAATLTGDGSRKADETPFVQKTASGEQQVTPTLQSHPKRQSSLNPSQISLVYSNEDIP